MLTCYACSSHRIVVYQKSLLGYPTPTCAGLLRSLRFLIPSPNPRNIRLRPAHRIRRRLLRHLLLPRHSRPPIQKQRSAHIKDDKRPHNPEIPPPRRILRAERRQVNIGVGSGAEFALARSIVVGEVAAQGI